MQMCVMYGNNLLIKRQTAVYKPESDIESQHHGELSNTAECGPRQYVQCSCCVFHVYIWRMLWEDSLSATWCREQCDRHKREWTPCRISEKAKTESKTKWKVANRNRVELTFSLDFVETKELPFTKTITRTCFSHLTQSQPIVHSALCGEISVCPYI